MLPEPTGPALDDQDATAPGDQAARFRHLQRWRLGRGRRHEILNPEDTCPAFGGDWADQAARRTWGPGGDSMKAWLKTPAPWGGTSRSAVSQSRACDRLDFRSSHRPAQHTGALGVRLDDRSRLIEGEREDSPRDVAADSRQGPDRVGGRGERSPCSVTTTRPPREVAGPGGSSPDLPRP